MVFLLNFYTWPEISTDSTDFANLTLVLALLNNNRNYNISDKYHIPDDHNTKY